MGRVERFRQLSQKVGIYIDRVMLHADGCGNRQCDCDILILFVGGSKKYWMNERGSCTEM